MKSLFYLLIIAGAAIAGYFLQPKVYEMGEEMRPKKAVVVLTKEQATAEAERTALMKEPSTKQSETQQMLDKMRNAIPGTSNKTAPPTEVSVATTDDEIDAKFPFRKVKPIEEITQNWMNVPDRAFPRKVKTTQPVEFKFATGKTTLPAGSDLMAFSFREGQMVLGYDEINPARTTVPHTSTNFQAMMTGLYTTYVEKLRNSVLAARQKAKYMRDNPAPPPPPVDEQAKLAGVRPVQDNEGKLDLMLEGIAAKQVTEVKAAQIQSWGPVKFEMDGGKGYWTCTVVVRISTMFGDNDTNVTAYINNGKIEKWIYTDSKEPVQ